MWHTDAFVELLFQLLNVAVLLVLGVYVFKKYLVDIIKTQMQDERQQVLDLQQRSDQLEAVVHAVDYQVSQESGLGHELQTRIMVWKARVDAEGKEHAFQVERAQHVIQERIVRKRAQVQSMYVAQYVVPRVIEQSKERLSRTFSDQQLGREFIQGIVDFMEKEEL